jgi:hypothetical protein
VLIIDVNKEETAVYFTMADGRMGSISSTRGQRELVENYVPVYADMFQYFHEQGRLPEPQIEKKFEFIQDLLTKEAIACIEETQQKKIKSMQPRQTKKRRRNKNNGRRMR